MRLLAADPPEVEAALRHEPFAHRELDEVHREAYWSVELEP
jgi:hypothetical protein